LQLKTEELNYQFYEKNLNFKFAFALLVAMLTGAANLQAQTNYGIQIAGTELTSANAGAINNANFPNLGLVSGTITYNYSTKTFTLKDVKASVIGAYNLFLSIDPAAENTEHKIILIGNNTIQTRYVCIATYRQLTIEGSGSLNITVTDNNTGIIVGNNFLTIRNTSLKVVSGFKGIVGNKYYGLKIEGSTVTVKGSAHGSIVDFQSITLIGSSITSPANAQIINGNVCDANGNIFKDEVKIEVDKYDLWICGTQVTGSNMNELGDVISEVTGTVSYNPDNKTLTLNNANITIPNGANAIRSAIEGLKIDVTGNNTVNSDGYATIRLEKLATIKGGGTLNVSQTSGGWALFTYGDSLTIENCKVNVTSNGRGITCNSTNVSKLIINNATVTATGTGDGSITHFSNINLINCAVSEPIGGRVSKGADTFNAIRDIDGNIIKNTVKIVPATVYDLLICGTPVTSLNKNDLSVLPGVNSGTVNYNPNTRTLTLNGATITDINGDAIRCLDGGINIELIGNNTVTGDGFAITFDNLKGQAPGSIHGSGTLNASSTIEIAIETDVPLTIKNCTVNAMGKDHGIFGCGKLTIDDATVSATGTDLGSISGFKDMELIGCDIVKPAGAVFDTTKHAICAADTIVKTEVKIVPAYELYICGEQVTSANMNDLSVINGVEGTVNYNSETRTLTLNNATITATSGDAIGCLDGGINIELIGNNTVTSGGTAIAFDVLKGQAPGSIYGNGTLNASAGEGGTAVYVSVPLTIKNCTVNAAGGFAGIWGHNNHKLIIDSATVSATGAIQGSISGFKDMELINCAIVKPAGAVFNSDNKAVCYADGTIVKEEVKIERNVPPAPNAYLTFSSANVFTITPSAVLWDGELFYSTDTTNWNEFTRAGATAVDNGTGTYTLHFRGKNNTRITGGNLSYWIIDADAASVACSGNIETLLDYTKVEAGEHPTMAAICFANLFRDCTALSSAPELPTTNLSDNCYVGMFRGCTGLTVAPALPATTVIGGCYQEMFRGCTSLVQAPELKAKTLPPSCYKSMFMDCTALKSAPELPATTLGATCYQYMFSNCTSLTKAPTLQAMTMSPGCYYSMFDSCTSLTAPPELPAKTLAPLCYYQMFIGCTSIMLNTEEPGIAWSIPADADATGATQWNTNMFAETSGNFTGAPEIGTTYYLPEYDLWICGEQVTAANKDDLRGTFANGTVTGNNVSYNPETNTLTLDGATISSSVDYGAIATHIDGLKIDVIGTNTITTTTNQEGIRFYGTSSNNIEGSGSLTINAPNYEAIRSSDTLVIKNCTIAATGELCGISGGNGGGKLIIDNATVSATGTIYGSIVLFDDIELIGCAIVEPAGAVFNPDNDAVCYADGTVVKEEVKIEPTGTGVKIIGNQSVVLYPNPVQDILHIQAEGAVIAVRVYNIHGAVVAQALNNAREINLSHLPTGIYMVRVEVGENVGAMRIIKN